MTKLLILGGSGHLRTHLLARGTTRGHRVRSLLEHR